MSELYLIAHKVRGEPAFDIATRMECPECHGTGRGGFDEEAWCDECDSLGYWWIVPTSGHRAYPYWDGELNKIANFAAPCEMPDSLPDHYTTRAAPATARPAFLSALIRPKAANIERRGL